MIFFQKLQSMITTRRVIIVGIVAILVTYLLFKPDPAVFSYVVTRGELERTVTATGRIEQTNEVSLSFQQSGTIQRIPVVLGQKVSEGTLLAQLDLGTLNADYREASADLLLARINQKKETLSLSQQGGNIIDDTARAKATLDALRLKLLSTDLEMSPVKPGATFAEEPLVAGIYSGPEDSVVIKLKVYPASSDSGYATTYQIGSDAGTVELSSRHYVAIGNTGLYVKLASSTVDGLAETEWTIDIPNTSAATYPANLYQYLEAKKTYESALTGKQNTVDISNVSYNGMNANDAAVMRAEAALARVNQSIRARGVYAPFAGTVGRISIKKGEQVTATTDTLALLGGGGFIIKLKVPESVIGGVRISDSVTVSLDAVSGKTLKGVVTAINTAETYVDGTPVYETTVAITDPDDTMKSGMHATGVIVLDSYTDAILVPDIAIDRSTGSPVVKKITQNQKGDREIVSVPVQILATGSNGFVSVTGVNPGDKIILPEKLPTVLSDSVADK